MSDPAGYIPAFGAVRDAVAAQLAATASSLTSEVQSIANTAQALANFRATYAEALAAFPVGTYFTCAASGSLRVYQRVGGAPGYTDQGDAAAPLSKGLLSGASGAGQVGLPDGGMVDSLEGPRRRIRALGLPNDGTTATPTDATGLLATLLSSTMGQHRIPVNTVGGLTVGGYKIGTSTIRVPRSVGFAGEGWSSRMVVAGDCDGNPVFAVNTDGAGNWIDAYPAALSVQYGNFFFDARQASAAGKHPLGFEVGASATFDTVHLLGFAQGFQQVSQYIDQITVRKVSFQQDEDNSGRYFIDLQWAGDGCVVDQAHCALKFVTAGDYTTAPRGRNTRYRYKVGSTISNALNGDHELYGCDGIDTYGWHMEFGQARLIGSSATLRNHNFWTHRADQAPNLAVSPILIDNIPGVANNAAGVVAISDCGMVVQQGFHGGYNIGDLTDISIVTPWYGHLRIERVYRKHRMAAVSAALGTKTGITTSDPTFVRYSHIASVRSDIIGGVLHITEKLPSLPSSTGGLNVAGSIATTDYGLWMGASGTYYYKALFFYDTVRCIGQATNNEISLTLTNGTGGAARLAFEDFTRKMVRLYRGTTSGSYDHYVDVPVIAGVSLTDVGTDVMGFPWQTRTAGPVDSINSGGVLGFEIAPAYTDLTNTLAYGNVKVYGYSAMTIPTTGSWRAGDMTLLKNPTGNSYIRFLGWRRLTNGNTHVLGTDWEEVEEQKKPPAAATSELTAATAPWNQQPLKRTGRCIFNVNLGKPIWAKSSASNGPWVDATGTVVITPA